MKTIIIYNSQTGFTERYANWLAEAVNGTCLEYSDAKKKDLLEYDALVFGGWACAGSIIKIKWFKQQAKKWPDKKLAVFCVGGTLASDPNIERNLRQNFSESELERIGVFYCPGGFNYEKMPVFSKLMMKFFIKTLQAKKNKTEEDERMIKMISSSYNLSDPKYLKPILQYLKKEY